MKDFDTATMEFTRFAAQQGYPNKLLWTSPEFAVVLRGRLFIFTANPSKLRLQGKATFENAAARNVGVAISGKCKTKTATVCHLYVPNDDLEAQYKMIPETGVKMSVALDPPPVALVESPLLWWMLKRLCKRPWVWW